MTDQPIPVSFVGSGNSPTTDTNHLALVTMDSMHRKIHDGQVFTASRFVDAVADGASIVVLIQTGTTACHMRITATSIGAAELALYETAVISGDEEGTAITSYNRNRASASAATATITHTPELSDNGTLISNHHTYEGHSSIEEWVLGASNVYQIILTNRDTAPAAQAMSVRLDWYEV